MTMPNCSLTRMLANRTQTLQQMPLVVDLQIARRQLGEFGLVVDQNKGRREGHLEC